MRCVIYWHQAGPVQGHGLSVSINISAQDSDYSSTTFVRHATYWDNYPSIWQIIADAYNLMPAWWRDQHAQG